MNNPLGHVDIVEPEAEASAQIHLRLFKRSARKSITTAEGLPTEWPLPKLLKALKQEFCCSGVVKDHGILQLSGDQRQRLVQFLVRAGLRTEGDFVIHGY